VPTSQSDNKWAIVTGASSGMGRCVALELSQRGWSTVLIARRGHLLSELSDQLSKTNRTSSVFLEQDLARTPEIVPAAEAFLTRHGIEPRVLINNAGFGLYRAFVEHRADDHEGLWRVNYLAAAEMIRCVLPGMLGRRAGHVINIASMSTKVGPWGHAGYAASKAALVSLTQTLAAEHPARRCGVHFSFVNPGIVSTNYFNSESFRTLWPRVKHRAIPPELVARKVAGLLDRPRLEICVPWYYRAIHLIDALSPALAHRIVAHESKPAGPDASRAP